MLRLHLRVMFPIILLLFLSGCWDQSEIKEQAIVIGIGIDKIPGNGAILLTAQVINPAASKNGNQGTSGSGTTGTTGGTSQATGSIVIETSTGRSFDDAIRNFLKYSSRRVIFFHNRIIIFGKTLAESGIAGILDCMARDSQFRRTNWLLVAEANAREILQSKTGLGSYPAQEINQMMINLVKRAFFLPVTLNDFLTGMYSEGKTSLMPMVAVGAPGTDPGQGGIQLERTAVFKNDRLIDVLTVEESQGLLWLADKQKGGSLVFPFQTGKGRKTISVAIMNGSTKIYPRITPEGILMDIFCTGTGTLRESEGLKNNPRTIQQLERRVESILKNRLERTIQKAQQIKADFPGFATLIHGEDPERWRRIKPDWDAEFPRIRTKIRFQINIAGFGLIKDSVAKPARQE